MLMVNRAWLSGVRTYSGSIIFRAFVFLSFILFDELRHLCHLLAYVLLMRHLFIVLLLFSSFQVLNALSQWFEELMF